jgi:hypothetical protein
VQSAGGDVAHFGIGDVVGLNLLENFRVDAHLAVGAILVGAGMNAEYAEFAHGKAEAECGEDGYGEDKNRTLKESRHRHPRADLKGKQAAYPLDAMISQGVHGREFFGQRGGLGCGPGLEIAC